MDAPVQGPKLRLIPSTQWDAHLKDAKVSAWYCAIPGVKPGAYSTQDGTSGPDAGDAIVVDSQFYEPAKRALACIAAGHKPAPADLVALVLIGHEFSHCYVRLDAAGHDLPDDVENYSHPGKAVPAIVHAVRRGFPVNAFTRVLRFRQNPTNMWADFLKWFAVAAAV